MGKMVSLKVNCPACGHSLMDFEQYLNQKPSIKLKIKMGKNKGVINLCSVYGSYEYVCSFDIPGNELAIMSCPHCDKILNTAEICDLCGAEMIEFDVDHGGKVCICSRAGCKKHYVAFENLNEALARFYEEYDY